MARKKTTPKKPKRAAPNRQRTAPLQVYLSASELASMARLRSHFGMSSSELVRLWVERATNALDRRRPSRSKQPTPPAADPRQLEVEDYVR